MSIINPYIAERKSFHDSRGSLYTVSDKDLDFQIRRVFTITSKETNCVRGGHGHKKCWQAFFSEDRNITLSWVNKFDKGNINLTSNMLIVVPPNNWCKLNFEFPFTSITVMCSEYFDLEDYFYEIE